MEQTLPSVLPNILIMKIIQMSDAGLNIHKKKFQFCLMDINQMVHTEVEFQSGYPEMVCPTDVSVQLRPRTTAIKFFHSFPLNEVRDAAEEQWFTSEWMEDLDENADESWRPVFPVWEYY
tara:strand:- start:67 stop:426 length:360 start_codon:yes stop_codon:yes gene_type:complete